MTFRVFLLSEYNKKHHLKELNNFQKIEEHKKVINNEIGKKSEKQSPLRE